VTDGSAAPVFEPLTGLRALSRHYDVLLCDVFGTLHDDDGLFPGAVRALTRFRADGRTVVLVSNAATSCDLLAQALAARGLPEDCYDAIITSADLARAMLAARGAVAVHHIGADRERVVFDGLDLRLVPVGSADVIVCTGYPPEGLASTSLAEAATRGLDLICTNPDRQILVGAKRLRFAGLVADHYQALGGRVIATGKPAPTIYRAALDKAEALRGATIPPARVLAIGDSFDLDVRGACNAGLAAIWIGDAGHDATLPQPTGPVFRLARLEW
jgi:HAD superfamily hydrolase (TIGR01459 family)